MQGKKLVWLCILFCICLLPGCSYQGNGTKTEPIKDNTTKDNALEGLSETPQFDYDLPLSQPGILVNQTGYSASGKKFAVFRGDDLPKTFEIVDANTGETVFAGEVEPKGYNRVIDENNGYGNFDAFTTKGEYYIQAKHLGRSYSFRIEDNIYNSIFELACRQYYYNRCGITLVEELAQDAAHIACHTKPAVLAEDPDILLDVTGGWHMDENGSKNVLRASQVMANLLLAYELYAEAFDDEGGIPESENTIPDILDELKYEADWMLKMQDTKTGGVYSEVIVKDDIPYYSDQNSFVEAVTLEATAAFSAVMAKFSYVYQAYDTEYATECLRAADRAWRFMEKSRNGIEIEQRFFAAAELYRATGYRNYRLEAEKYLKSGIYEHMEIDSNFWGCVTYISTKQKVNTDICSSIIKVLMRQAEEISSKSKESQYLTAGNKAQDNNAQLMEDMARLTVVDHIITNHEYETVIENHLHYFLGRNSMAISYIDYEGEKNYADIDIRMGIMNHIDLNAELIFMMSEIMSWHKNFR